MQCRLFEKIKQYCYNIIPYDHKRYKTRRQYPTYIRCLFNTVTLLFPVLGIQIYLYMVSCAMLRSNMVLEQRYWKLFCSNAQILSSSRWSQSVFIVCLVYLWFYCTQLQLFIFHEVNYSGHIHQKWKNALNNSQQQCHSKDIKTF